MEVEGNSGISTSLDVSKVLYSDVHPQETVPSAQEESAASKPDVSGGTPRKEISNNLSVKVSKQHLNVPGRDVLRKHCEVHETPRRDSDILLPSTKVRL